MDGIFCEKIESAATQCKMITDFGVSAYGFYKKTRAPAAAASVKRRDDFHVRPHCLGAIEYVSETDRAVLAKEYISVGTILLRGTPSKYALVSSAIDEIEPPASQFLDDIRAGLGWLFSYESITFSGCAYNFYGVKLTDKWPPVAGMTPDFISINATGVYLANKFGTRERNIHFKYYGVIPKRVSNRRRFEMTKFTVYAAQVGRSRALVVPTLADYARDRYERATVSKSKYDALVIERNLLAAKCEKVARGLDIHTTKLLDLTGYNIIHITI